MIFVSRHTQGPWKIESASPSQTAITDVVITDDGQSAVAFVPRGHPDATANARLIASAPGLLVELAETASLREQVATLKQELESARKFNVVLREQLQAALVKGPPEEEL